MEYVVSLLLFIALIVAFIQVSFVEHLEFNQLADGKCMSSFKPVGDKCVSIDPGAYEARVLGRPPCPSGQIEHERGVCIEPCVAGKKLDGYICTSSTTETTAPAPVLSPVGVPSCKIESFSSF